MMNPQNTPRKRVTNDPMAIIQEALMCPTELMHWLARGAVELYALGAEPEDAGPGIFTDAMGPVAAAWSLEDGELEQAQAIVARQREATLNHREGEDYPLMVDESKLFQDPSAQEIISVIGTLVDTMVWLEVQADRQAIAKLIYYLKDYWAIGECLAY